MIRLEQFLKFHGMCSTGGGAKTRIQAGEVLVNDEVETRRKRQLQVGDKVSLDGELVVVSAEDFPD